MSMAWRKWTACASGANAMRQGKLQKFGARVAHATLAKAFNTWHDVCARPKAVAEAHWERRCAIKAVRTWAAAVGSKKRAVAACVARWMRQKLTSAFNAWVAFAVKRNELRARAVGRMMYRKLAMAFRKWANEVWGTEYDRWGPARSFIRPDLS